MDLPWPQRQGWILGTMEGYHGGWDILNPAGGMADNPEDPLPNLSISGHQTTQLPSVTKSKQHGGAPPFRVWFLRWSLPFLGQSFCLGGSAFPHISTVSPNSLNPANPFKSVDFRPSYSNDTP